MTVFTFQVGGVWNAPPPAWRELGAVGATTPATAQTGPNATRRMDPAAALPAGTAATASNRAR